MTRFGKRVAVLRALHIDHPVGRDGARFQAYVATAELVLHDTTQLRFFVVQDDAGNRYPAMIERTVPGGADDLLTTIIGVVVAGW
ncbi:MAG: hypothetical protein ABIQ16_25390 [Polyangiaceae bacterium]